LFEFARTRRSPSPSLLYGLVAVIGAFELVALWQGVHPAVPELYRGYYIDKTTTCLNQPGSGDYAFGTELRLRSGKEAAIKPIKVCGWEGPAGDGLHAVGESSRLHFALPQKTGDVALTLEMVAVDLQGAGQSVEVVANGQSLGTVSVPTGTPQRSTFTVPASTIGTNAALDLELKYPQAILVSPQDSNLRKRSIKLSAVSIQPAR
jgi:hypothetical protein